MKQTKNSDYADKDK
ncbi:23S rRNA methyltransferase attenuation leader peptide [Enterococcus avium]|nr:23S rRNA methyltransferase attenuation leader peptide [Enterococcus avium]MDT2494805.1 23S rRNA methyltransferase attenuation leader peptide [Enterococcus avium]